MRYDEGYGRHGGWEMRMPDGGRGFHGGYPRPGGGADAGDRPWVGGYREGYQGGSGGYALRTTGPLYEEYEAHDEGGPPHERGYRRPRGQAGRGPRGRGYFVRARAGYGGDFHGGGGDPAAYQDPAADTDYGASGARPGFGRLGHLGGGYGGDFRTSGGGYGGDYDRGMRGGGYDLPFRNEGRPEDYHPRYSPVDGTYAPMGGSYAAYRAGGSPRPRGQSRYDSAWTRWF